MQFALTRRSCFRLLGTVMLIPMIAASSRAADHIPATRPVMTTYRDCYGQYLEVNRETLVGAYQKLGQHNPKWDRKVVELFELVNQDAAASDMPDFYRLKDPSRRTRTLALCDEIRTAGCNDPLFLYGDALLHGEGWPRSDVAAGVRRALEELKRRKYPLARILMVSAALSRLTEDLEERERLMRFIPEQLPSLCSGKLSDAERRVYLEMAWPSLRSRNQQRTFAEAMKSRADADPWVLDVADGRLNVLLAWDSRGNGAANTVTPEGWRGFHERMSQARDALTRAWKLAPHLPEAPKEMIIVAMGDGRKLNEDKLDWFDRAVKAQIDYAPTYSAMIQATLPRWGGSYEEMLKLADGCIQEPIRFDTLVPFHYLLIVKAIGEDANKPWGPMSNPHVYDSATHVLEGYAKKFRPADGGNYYKTLHALFALRFNKFAEARKVFDEMIADKQQPDAQAMKEMQVDSPPAIIVALAYAMSSPDTPLIVEAHEMAKKSDFAGALDRLRAIRQRAAAAGDRAVPYHDLAIRKLDASLKYQKGEWSPLLRQDSLDEFAILEGEWKLDEQGRLVGSNPAAAPKLLIWRGRAIGRDPGGRFEISATLHFPATGQPHSANQSMVPTTQPSAPAMQRTSPATQSVAPATLPATQPVLAPEHRSGGILIYNANRRVRGLAILDFGSQQAGFVFGRDQLAYPCNAKQGCVMVVRVNGHTLTLLIDGKQIGQPYELGEEFAGEISVGVGAVDGLPVQFTDLRIRKLPAEHAAPATRPEEK